MERCRILSGGICLLLAMAWMPACQWNDCKLVELFYEGGSGDWFDEEVNSETRGDLEIEVTEYGEEGGWIIGTFEGEVVDTNGARYDVTDGTFQVQYVGHEPEEFKADEDGTFRFLLDGTEVTDTNAWLSGATFDYDFAYDACGTRTETMVGHNSEFDGWALRFPGTETGTYRASDDNFSFRWWTR